MTFSSAGTVPGSTAKFLSLSEFLFERERGERGRRKEGE